MKNRVLSFSEFINEKYSEKLNLPKNRWQKIDPEKHPELKNEFFELISIAYSSIGGHAKINNPLDVFRDKNWNYWKAVDIDEHPDIDIVVFGSKTKYGIKFAGVGHDGSKEAKREYVKNRAEKLNMNGYYGEVSLKFAEILLRKYNVPVVNSKTEVEKILGKEIKWHGKHPTDKSMPGDGWYSRTIGGSEHIKIMVGRPKT